MNYNIAELKYLLFFIIILGIYTAPTFQTGEDEEVYVLYNHSITLKCHENEPGDEELFETWVVDQSPYSQYELEHEQEEHNYEWGSDNFDIIIKSVTKNMTAYCKTKASKGANPDEQKRYSLIIGRLPTVTIYANERKLQKKLESEAKETLVRCDAKDGLPQSNITLFLNNTELTSVVGKDSVSYNVNLTRRDDGTIFKCLVDTIYQTIDHPVTVDILYRPEIMEDSVSKQRTSNGDGELSVYFKSYPEPGATVRGSSEICNITKPRKRRQTYNGTYILNDAELKKESGKHWFSATVPISEIRKGTKCIHVTVNNTLGQDDYSFDPRTVPTYTEVEVYVLYNHSITLKCHENEPSHEEVLDKWVVDQTPYTQYELEHEQEEHNYEWESDNFDIIIKSVTKNMTAYCRTHLYEGAYPTTQERYSLIIGRLPTVTIYANGTKVEKTLKSEAKETSVRCDAKDGLPQSNITLFLGNKKLTSVVGKDSVSYNVSLTRRDDGKVFKCSVNTIYETIDHSLPVDILFAPKLMKKSVSKPLMINEEFELSLFYESNPPPKVSWEFSENCEDTERSGIFEERYNLNAEPKNDSGKHQFSSSFSINKVLEEDTTRCIHVTAKNEHGIYENSIELSSFAKYTDSDDGTSAGQIVGIVFGVILGVLVALLIGYFGWRTFRKSKTSYIRADGNEMAHVGT